MTQPQRLFQGDLLTRDQAAPVYEGRDPLDRYYSPSIWVDVLLDVLGVTAPLSVLEPCAGRPLRLSSRLAEFGHDVTTCDLDAGAVVDHHRCIFTHPWEARSFDAVVTNPPYKVRQGNEQRHAADAVRAMIPVARQFVAMALRLSFLEPCQNRVDLLGGPYRPSDIITLPRYAFVAGGGSVSVCWFVWDTRSSAALAPPYTRTHHITQARLDEYEDARRRSACR